MNKIKEITESPEFRKGLALITEGKNFNDLGADEKKCYDLAAQKYFNEELKVKFSRHDGQTPNYLPVNYKDRWVQFKGNLISGGIYVLKRGVVEFLRTLSVPRYTEKHVTNEVGRQEVKLGIIGEEPRFSLVEVA